MIDENKIKFVEADSGSSKMNPKLRSQISRATEEVLIPCTALLIDTADYEASLKEIQDICEANEIGKGMYAISLKGTKADLLRVASLSSVLALNAIVQYKLSC